MKRTADLLVLVNREMLKIMSRTDKKSRKEKVLHDARIYQIKYQQYIKRNIRTRHK